MIGLRLMRPDLVAIVDRMTDDLAQARKREATIRVRRYERPEGFLR